MTAISTDILARAPRLKIERAKHHIRDLTAKINAFLADRPFKFVAKHEPKARKMTLISKREKTIPDELSLIAGDAVHNLCAALDITIYGMAQDKATNPFELMFPFVRKQESLEGRINSTQAHFAGTCVVETIRALRPYPGGNEILSGIHRLDNRDKHRLLILTAQVAELKGPQIARFLIGLPFANHLAANQRFVRITHSGADEMPIYEVLGADYFELIRQRGSDAGFEVEADLQPTFRIAFGQGQPFEDNPVIALLNVCADRVEKAIDRLIAAFLDPRNIR